MNRTDDIAPCDNSPTRWVVAAAYGVALMVFFLDGVTKQLTRQVLGVGDSIAVTPFFNYVHWRNTGAAFSMLADSGGWQRWALVAVAAGVAVALGWWLCRETSTPMRWGYALLLGGAVSNGVERAVRGYVTDFLDFHWSGLHWPAFNVADMAICAAVVLILWGEFARKKAHG